MPRDDLDIPPPSPGTPSYRVSRRPSGMDPNTKRLTLIAGGIGAALLVLMGAWSLSGGRRMAGGSAGGLPVVEAASGPVRIKPDKPGGLQVFGGDDAGAESGVKEAMAPPPETPDPQALRAPPATSTSAPPPVPNTTQGAAAAPATPAATRPPPVAAETAAQSVPPKAEAKVELKRPTPPATLAASPPVSPPGSGNAQVQLAALTSEEAAKTEWARLSHKMPDLLGNRHPAVSRTERDGRVYWRLRTGGFADAAQASSFCQQVREKGGGCSVASF